MLKRVKIQGYKSLADVEVHLQPLSVLFGINASGKSNFLDALQLLSKIVTSNNLNDAFSYPYRGTPLESFTFGPEGIPGLRAQERVSFSIEVDVELSQTVIDSVNQRIQKMEGTKTAPSSLREKYVRYRIEIEMRLKTGRLRVVDEYVAALNAKGEPTKRRPFLERIDDNHFHLRAEGQGHPTDYTDLDHSILSEPLYPPHYPYVVAIRQELSRWFFYSLEPRERMRIPTPFKEVRQIGLMGEELNAFLYTLRATNERQFGAVEKALHMIIPSITGIDVGVNNFSGEVELRLMEGKTFIPARVLSDGTLRILGLLALTGMKDQPTLLGLEEPENGVHPGSLDLIALFLETRALTGTQVIITTHSPTLVDLISMESLYSFRQINGKTVITSLSSWRAKRHKPNTSNGIEEETPVSERILRGDFSA